MSCLRPYRTGSAESRERDEFGQPSVVVPVLTYPYRAEAPGLVPEAGLVGVHLLFVLLRVDGAVDDIVGLRVSPGEERGNVRETQAFQ